MLPVSYRHSNVVYCDQDHHRSKTSNQSLTTAKTMHSTDVGHQIG